MECCRGWSRSQQEGWSVARSTLSWESLIQKLFFEDCFVFSLKVIKGFSLNWDLFSKRLWKILRHEMQKSMFDIEKILLKSSIQKLYLKIIFLLKVILILLTAAIYLLLIIFYFCNLPEFCKRMNNCQVPLHWYRKSRKHWANLSKVF